MKRKYHIIFLVSHLTVLIALLTPIIRVSELRINMAGDKTANSYYTNIIEFVRNDIYSSTSVLMLALVFLHICGIAIAIYGIFAKKQGNYTSNASIALGFSSALMGALHLYSKSYALFAICFVSFFAMAICSIKTVKSQK